MCAEDEGASLPSAQQVPRLPRSPCLRRTATSASRPGGGPGGQWLATTARVPSHPQHDDDTRCTATRLARRPDELPPFLSPRVRRRTLGPPDALMVLRMRQRCPNSMEDWARPRLAIYPETRTQQRKPSLAGDPGDPEIAATKAGRTGFRWRDPRGRSAVQWGPHVSARNKEKGKGRRWAAREGNRVGPARFGPAEFSSFSFFCFVFSLFRFRFQV
jgi:hypothetical protein